MSKSAAKNKKKREAKARAKQEQEAAALEVRCFDTSVSFSHHEIMITGRKSISKTFYRIYCTVTESVKYILIIGQSASKK